MAVDEGRIKKSRGKHYLKGCQGSAGGSTIKGKASRKKHLSAYGQCRGAIAYSIPRCKWAHRANA